MGVSPDGSLLNLYWGAPLWRIADLPAAAQRHDISSFDPRQMLENEEFPGWGGPRYYEPALKITREDGDRDLVLQYVSHTAQADQLDIVMKDIHDDIQVVLHYRIYPEYGVIRSSATIINKTAQPITLESAQSAVWNLPTGEGYQLTYLDRTLGRRRPAHPRAHPPGRNRHGKPQGPHQPLLQSVVRHRRRATPAKRHGRVWFGALGWSGNWRITVEQTPYQQVRVTGGFNTFDFAYPLQPGESLETPPFYGGFSADGFGGASRLLHRFEREEILPGGLPRRLRPVLYNSWEATTFNVNEAGQKAAGR